MDEKNLPRCCALAYRCQDEVLTAKSDPNLIIVAVLQPDATLKIYKHPKLEEIVEPCDGEYLSDLLRDMAKRLKVNGEGLFAQLCELSVGPLTTERIGLDPASDETLSGLIQNFIEI